MKKYLIIPNELLVSPDKNPYVAPVKKVKMEIMSGESLYFCESSGLLPAHIHYDYKMNYEYQCQNNHC